MAKKKSADTKSEKATPPAKRRRMAILGLLGLVGASASGAAGYHVFGPASAEASHDSAAAPTEIPVPMPAAIASAPKPPQASDYEIVSIYRNEAILAAGTALIRVKVGSVAPGLGTVTAITAAPNGGGSVAATEATLRTV